MCLFSAPKVDAPAAPTPPQEAKMPEQKAYGTSEARKRMAQSGGAAASTLLTGPSGIETALPLGRSTLLGT